jgi:cytochrome c oxidase assembly factor CtaG
VADSGPYAWDAHLAAWAVVAVGVTTVVLTHLRLERSAGQTAATWERKRLLCFAVAVVGLVVALTWPVADLAAHWSLTVLVVQRLLLLLLVAPMLWLGLPDDVLRRMTRPAFVDAVLARVQRPPVAVVIVTVVLVGSMTPGLVQAQAASALSRGLIDAAVLLAGLVLWLPVIGRLPGIPRPKPIVRFGYLVFQAVVPAFVCFIYIFSRHPLYETFSRSWSALHVRPLTDQQMAGFISKLTMLIVLLTVGSVVLARASRSEEDLLDEPLVWADVERAFERVDRRRDRRGGAGPDAADPPADTPGSSGIDRPTPPGPGRRHDDPHEGPTTDGDRGP